MNIPKTWEKAARNAMERLLRDCKQPYDTFVPCAENNWGTLFEWAYYDDVMWGFKLDNLVGLLADKQHDYGYQNILAYGEQGVRVRISDKLARIAHLRGKGVSASNESLKDSFIDICGYAVIGQMLDDGTFTLPLADDVSQETETSQPAPGTYKVQETETPQTPGTYKARINGVISLIEFL